MKHHILLWLAISTTGGVFAKKDPQHLIEALTVTHNTIRVKVNQSFKKKYLKSDFFVEYDEDIDLEQFDYSILSLPFLMNVISLVWISQEDYIIDEMDTEIYESLERLKKVFEIMYPHTSWNGRILPKKLVTHQPLKENVPGKMALLFSGGVDSTTSSLYHRTNPQLLITAWGQSELPLDEPGLWKEKQRQMIDFARQYGHDNAFLKSNYYYFLDFSKLKHLSPEILTWRMDTIEDIGWAGLIAPILLAKGIKTLRIASSEHWALRIASASNPYIDDNIRFVGLEFHHDLYSMSRCEKICTIVNLCNQGLIQKPRLIICQKPGNVITCGSCEKCCLTLALLLYAGADPQEYGFLLTQEQASRRIQKHLDERESYMPQTLWDYQDLQNRLQNDPPPLLAWLTKIDFSQKKALKKDSRPLMWIQLEQAFPDIRSQTN